MPKIDIDGTVIHYISNRESLNPEEAQILYIHGTGCNARVFEQHINALPSYQAVALDLSGHGESGGAGYRGVVDHAHLVAEFMRRLGGHQWILAGHSLGGGIALAVAIYYPEGLRGMMLIDTGARLRVAPAMFENAKKIAAGHSDASTHSRLGFSDRTTQTTIDALWQITDKESSSVTLKDWYADDSCDFLTRVSEINLPSVAICGREDLFTPFKYHEYFRDHMPACELRVIDEAGHWPFVEQPARFNAEVIAYPSKLGEVGS